MSDTSPEYKKQLPSSTVVAIGTIESSSFTLGVEGITRKKEFNFWMRFSLSMTGKESDRDMGPTSFVYNNHQHNG